MTTLDWMEKQIDALKQENESLKKQLAERHDCCDACNVNFLDEEIDKFKLAPDSDFWLCQSCHYQAKPQQEVTDDDEEEEEITITDEDMDNMFCKKCGELHYQYDMFVSKEMWLKWCGKENITPCMCVN
jgi:hypothetical protein